MSKHVTLLIALILVADSSSITAGGLPQSLTLEFRLNAAVYSRDGVETEIPVYPVQMMLIDRESGKILVGPGEMKQGGEVFAAGTTVFDDNFRILYPDNQIVLLGSAHADRQYRLFLRPSLEFWCPDCATPGFVGEESDLKEEGDFLILGTLHLRDDEYGYSFPSSPEAVEAGERLEFTHLRDPQRRSALGFTAFVDFDVVEGLIRPLGGEDTEPLVLRIDSTASGQETSSGSFGRSALRAGQ